MALPDAEAIRDISQISLSALPAAERTPKNNFFLAVADTIHDAWKGYRGTSINDSNAEKNIQKSIVNIVNNKTITDPKCKPDPNAFDHPRGDYGYELQECLLENKVKNIRTGDIEDRTILYFESIGLPCKTKIYTYDEIVGGVEPDMTLDVIEIIENPVADSLTEKKLDPNQRRIVANFILKYLTGPSYDEPQRYTRFTFDMAQGSVGKIFRQHPNVKGLITPMNIADSATTILDQLGLTPDDYIFPKTEQESSSYISKRNLFTYRAYEISMREQKDKVFNENTPYNFSYVVKRGQNETSGDFSEKVKQGTSLNDLLQLHLGAKAGKPYNEIEPQLTKRSLQVNFSNNWDGIVQDIDGNLNSIFLDMKRGGDQDQVDGASFIDSISNQMNVVLVTGDRLCSLASRLRCNRTILQNGPNITLFKKQQCTAPQAGIAQTTKQIEESNTIDKLINLETRNRVLKNLESFITSLRSGNYPDFTISNIISKELYSNKIADINLFLNKIKSILDGTIRQYGEEQGKYTGQDGSVLSNNIYYRYFFEKIGMNTIQFREMMFLFDRPEADRILFKPEIQFTFLNYSSHHFKELNSSYKTINDLISKALTRRTIAFDYYKEVFKKDGFASITAKIIYSIKDDTILKHLDKFTGDRFRHIQNNITREQLQGIWRSFLIQVQAPQSIGNNTNTALARAKAVINAEEAAANAAEAAANIQYLGFVHNNNNQGGGAIIQRGGAAPTTDIIELLGEITSLAAAYVNTIYSSIFPYKNIISTIEKAKSTNDYSRLEVLKTLVKMIENDMNTNYNPIIDVDLDTLKEFIQNNAINLGEFNPKTLQVINNFYSYYLYFLYKDDNTELNLFQQLVEEINKGEQSTSKNDVLQDIYSIWNNGLELNGIIQIDTSSIKGRVLPGPIISISKIIDPLDSTGRLFDKHPLKIYYDGHAGEQADINNKIDTIGLIFLAFLHDMIYKNEINNGTSLFIEMIVDRTPGPRHGINKFFRDYNIKSVEKWDDLYRFSGYIMESFIKNSPLTRELRGILSGGKRHSKRFKKTLKKHC
jgi:hypothetical protein